MIKFYVILGDWSDDGHGKSDKVLLEANKTIKEMQDAYKASCKKTGISFNHNDDFTGRRRKYEDAEKYRICVENEQRSITPEIYDILEKHGCSFELLDQLYNDELWVEDHEEFIALLMWFIGLSLPGLEYSNIVDKIPVLNGFWSDNLNVQFGYGLY